MIGMSGAEPSIGHFTALSMVLCWFPWYKSRDSMEIIWSLYSESSCYHGCL